MKKLIVKLLGLESLVTEVLTLRKENEELKAYQKDLTMAQEGLRASLDELTEQVDEIEIPDMDDYVASCDLDSNIETYLNDNEYVSSSYVDDEIESKVSDAVDDADIDSKIESAIEDIDLDDKVRDIVISEMQKTHPVLMTEDTIRKEVSEAVKVTLERVVKAMANQQG